MGLSAQLLVARMLVAQMPCTRVPSAQMISAQMVCVQICAGRGQDVLRNCSTAGGRPGSESAIDPLPSRHSPRIGGDHRLRGRWRCRVSGSRLQTASECADRRRRSDAGVAISAAVLGAEEQLQAAGLPMFVGSDSGRSALSGWPEMPMKSGASAQLVFIQAAAPYACRPAAQRLNR